MLCLGDRNEDVTSLLFAGVLWKIEIRIAYIVSNYKLKPKKPSCLLASVSVLLLQ